MLATVGNMVGGGLRANPPLQKLKRDRTLQTSIAFALGKIGCFMPGYLLSSNRRSIGMVILESIGNSFNIAGFHPVK